MPISALKSNPRNPREISDLALLRLQKSVERFGLVEPIVYNKRSGYIVGGHQRVKALKRLGEKEATVVVVDLDETDEKALNIALNSANLMGEFVQESLEEILEEIQSRNHQLADDLGFTARDMDLDMRIKVVAQRVRRGLDVDRVTKKFYNGRDLVRPQFMHC
jgi:ParB-like chromosome segregation protein Spo0J